MTPYLKLMVEKNASDIFITTGAPVKVKLEGVITSVGKTILTDDICKAAAYNIMNDTQAKHFEETMECDFAIALEDKSARFRVNIFDKGVTWDWCFALFLRKYPRLSSWDYPKS